MAMKCKKRLKNLPYVLQINIYIYYTLVSTTVISYDDQQVIPSTAANFSVYVSIGLDILKSQADSDSLL